MKKAREARCYRWHPVFGEWQYFSPIGLEWVASFAYLDDEQGPPRFKRITYATTWAEPERGGWSP